MITVELSEEAAAMLRHLLASQQLAVGAPGFIATAMLAAETLTALDEAVRGGGE